MTGHPGDEPGPPRRRAEDRSRSLLRGGAVGMALVTLATAALVATAAVIAVVVALLG